MSPTAPCGAYRAAAPRRQQPDQRYPIALGLYAAGTPNAQSCCSSVAPIGRSSAWGYRIELDEIEAALTALPEVREAACVALLDHAGGTPVILAALCTELPEAELQAQLAEHLPAYMLPTRLTYDDNLPRNRNGKINRLAIAEQGDRPQPSAG